MARDWRSLALAALTAAALALTGAFGAEAQTSANTAKAAKAAPKPPQKAAEPADDDEPEELKPEAKPKRKKQDPVEAQRAIEGALKLLENGKADQAVQTLTNTISGGNLPPAMMAKAMLYRGMAYRQQQKPAQAISDITGALWLKGGLSPTDRTNAQQQRAAAYQEAGLTENGEALPKSAAKDRPAQTSSNWGAAASTSSTETASSSTSSQWGSGWGNWFGGGSSSSSQTTQAQPKQEVAPFATSVKAATEPKASSTSSWTSGTEVRSAPAETLTQTQRTETAAITPARPEGRFSVQVAMVRSQDEAKALAAKVKRDYAAVFASRETDIDQTVVGNMGTFYRVKVGPFATQNEGQAACARLKGSGLDCMVVTQ
jgi:cell division septation protein DedD